MQKEKTEASTLLERRGRWMLFGLAGVLLGMFSPATDGAEAAELLLACKPQTETTTRSVACDIRTTTPYSPSKLVISANGSVLTESAFVPFRTSGQTTAWLYLIDRSNPARAATVQRNVALAAQMLDRASSTMKIGVATFAGDMQTLLPIASTHTNAAQQLQGVRADGVATEFFANSLEAIKMLADVNADRKALVVISDGKAEDTAYSLADVVTAARQAGVTIMGLGYAERATETPALQPIRRMAEETNGFFRAVVGAEQLPSGFLDDLTRYIDNGGTVTAPLGDLEGDVAITVDATLQDNTALSASQTIKIDPPPKAAEPVAEPLSLIARIYAVFDRVFDGASQWANSNGWLAWLCLLLPLLLIGALAGMLMARRRRVEAEASGDTIAWQVANDLNEMPIASGFDLADDGATRKFSPNATSEFGYFEIVGNESKRYPINSQSVSIGRHSDNDIQLTNDSVHRHHAHLRVTPGGQVVIRDLDTQNGVIVNGGRVPSKQLSAGDLVELGEVRMRYQAD